MSEATCGSDAGYKRHTRRREASCAPCRKAHAEYIADYRTRNPAVPTQQRRQATLRQKTLSRLARLYPQEYRRIFSEVVAEDRATQRQAGNAP